MADYIHLFDDVLYAGAISVLLTIISDDPALAAAMAASLVLLVRGLGYLTLQAGKYLQARALHIQAETEALQGDGKHGVVAKLELGTKDPPD